MVYSPAKIERYCFKPASLRALFEPWSEFPRPQPIVITMQYRCNYGKTEYLRQTSDGRYNGIGLVITVKRSTFVKRLLQRHFQCHVTEKRLCNGYFHVTDKGVVFSVQLCTILIYMNNFNVVNYYMHVYTCIYVTAICVCQCQRQYLQCRCVLH